MDRKSKVLKFKGLLIILFIFLSLQCGFIKPVKGQEIIVEYADTVIEHDLVNSTTLDEAIGTVNPRIIVEYIDALIQLGLINSTILNDLLDGVDPRIIVEYADFIFQEDLVDSTELNDLLATVDPRIIVQYVDTLIQYGLLNSTLLDNYLDGVGPRIIVEYVDTVLTYNLILNTPPNPPTSLGQFESDNNTELLEFSTTNDTTIIFKGHVNDPDGDDVRLEIELREYGQSFTGTPTIETISDYISSGTEAVISRSGLIEGDYHWQYRAKDENGATSAWQEYGTEGNIDFTIDIPGDDPPNTELIKGPSGLKHYNDFNFTWTGSDDITPSVNLVFSYYLEGYDSDWSDWTSETNKYYNQLENGTYIFKVKAKDQSEYIDESPAERSFEVSIPKWRKSILIGDILNLRSCGLLASILHEWTHTGIYVGEGKVIEALSEGVLETSIINWDYPTQTYCTLLRVKPSTTEIRNSAARWAKKQEEKNYVLSFYEKLYDANEPDWYCSELVWAAYFNQGINLDVDDVGGYQQWNGVKPGDIYEDSNTEEIDSHMEYRPSRFCYIGKVLNIKTKCPVDLKIEDPAGNVISKNSIDKSSCYFEDDFDEDGEIEDIILIDEFTFGEYTIEILAEQNASITDTFSLYASFGNFTLPIAIDIPIENIPSDPYRIRVSENGITLITPQGEEIFIPGYNLVFIISLIGLAMILTYSIKNWQNKNINSN